MSEVDFMSFDDISDAPPTIPAGEYVARVVDAKVETKKDGSGKYISYRTVVQGGPHAGYSVRGIYSLGGDQVWRFKRDVKALELEIPQGLSVAEAAQSFAEQMNGVDVTVQFGTKVRQVKETDANGNAAYVADPDGALENTIKRIVGLA